MKLIHENLPPGLYVVAISIGNQDDLTMRALDILRQVEAVICEEYREGARLLKSLGLDKPLHLLNEHSKPAEIKQLFEDLLILKDKAVALITDAGTPGFADPGAELVQLCHDYQVPVYPVPGASSLMAALMVSGLSAKRFVYYGFLSAKREERQQQIKDLAAWSKWDIVLLEAPYRLKALVDDLGSGLGRQRRIRLFYKLTQPQEHIFLGTLEELGRSLSRFPKGEFVLILEHVSRR